VRRSNGAVIACLDVAYGEDGAAVAAVLIRDWQDAAAHEVLTRRCDVRPASYKPGAFFERELPLLLLVIKDIGAALEAIVIDGYVWLGPDGEPGLGAHLYAALENRIPIVGVAKTRYRHDTWSAAVLRGRSQKPLFVTAAGIQTEQAADNIRAMHGAHRIPTILAVADRAAREQIAR
jgi:deoxyribonuclease V